jgi:hypothetical protein
LDRKRTLIEAWKRNAREGHPSWEIREEDKRFKSWEIVPEKQRNAVVIAMRDVSGSMGEFEAYIARSFYYWMVRFLRTKYTATEIVFITCHTEAHEVDEHAFSQRAIRAARASPLPINSRSISSRSVSTRASGTSTPSCSPMATTGATTRWWSICAAWWSTHFTSCCAFLLPRAQNTPPILYNGW